MQQVNGRARRAALREKLRRAARSGDGRTAELRWGIAGLVVVVLLVIAIGAVYVTGTTPEREYAADLAQAGSIRTGDDVRVAGIPVGKVKSLTLLPDRVRLRFTVDDEVFLGSQTALDIRMLTVVGGYYLAVLPAGTQPLGSAVIPRERVTLPYNLTQVFQDAVRPVREIDGSELRRTLAALATSVDTSPDAFRAAVRAVGDLTGIMNRQNADISRTLALADEYLSALRANSDVLVRLVNALAGMEMVIRNNRSEIAQALDDLATVLHGLTPLGRAWDANLKERARPLADQAIPMLQELGTRLGALLDSVRDLELRLLPLLPDGGGVTVDRSAATVSLPGVCVPVPGGGC
ncbi:MlaD family protein [Nocardia blacklockiae]|uniref:MlaD family protein n=1 Tax=Nocardia blacklockiae TaxID=480036 RepID=UPI0018954DA6|nr:MlaD family protein [Nocardia blacklockiae]MBF6171900.1 MCE family protein [Nocardia blacklockiae]